MTFIYSWFCFLFSDGVEEDQGGEVRQRSKSIASGRIREKKVCNIYITFYQIMFRWMCFCFIFGKRMDDPEEEWEEDWEEEWEEDWEEEPGRERSGKRRGLRRGTRRRNMKRTIKQKVCLYLHDWRHVSHILLIIHLLFTDGWRMEDAEDDNWEWSRTWTGTFVWKKMSMKQSVHPQLSLYNHWFV